MWKYLSLLLVISTLFSCAARKVAVNKTQKKTFTDSIVVEKKDSVSIIQNSIIVTNSTDEIEVTPIDTTQPLIIGETKYYNSRVKIKKIKLKSIDSSIIFIAKSNHKKTDVKKKIENKIHEKEINKKANYLFYLWFLLIPLAAYIVIRNPLK